MIRKTIIFSIISLLVSICIFAFSVINGGSPVLADACGPGYYCSGNRDIDWPYGCTRRLSNGRCYTDWWEGEISCPLSTCNHWLKTIKCKDNGSFSCDTKEEWKNYGCCVIDESCSCTSWDNKGCGTGSCESTERRYERDCTPNLCDSEAKCVEDPSCTPCLVTAPTNPSVAPEATSADLSWTPGGGGVQQLIRIGTDLVEVKSGCPGGAGEGLGCVVAESLSLDQSVYETDEILSPETTYYWRVVEYETASCWMDFGGVIGVASAVSFTTPPLIYGPWWQVQDADIITNGSLFSLIPTTACLLPGCDPVFGLEGPGGYPGVPSYGGSYDFEKGGGTGTVSSTGWLANSMTTLNKVYDYSYFEGLVRPDVEINEIIEPEIQGGYLINQGNATRGYVWFKRQGDLTITGTANLQDRKVVLLVDGDLYLGRPPAQSGSKIRVRDGSGFFMAIVSGDIIISPKAEIDPLNPEPVFEGIFLAEGQVKTGTEGPELDEQLWIRGSVAAYGGVVLERDLTDNSVTPAEFFEYGPDLLFTFPRDLTSRRYKWKEIAP